MKRALSTEDGKPIKVFKPTFGRLVERLEWGRDAGRASFARGQKINPFRELRHMPMHRGWLDGYEEAERTKADAESENASFRDGGRS